MKEHSFFTDHVRDLIGGGNSVPKELFNELKVDLVSKLLSRGLTPSALAYAGADWNDEALEEIASHCYSYAFLGITETSINSDETSDRQRPYLWGKVKSGKPIEGLVRKKIGWFIIELHERKYPKDSGVHKNLRKALKILVSENRPDLRPLSGLSEKIDNNSTFGREGSSPSDCIVIDELGDFVKIAPEWVNACKQIARFSTAATESSKTAICVTADADKIPFRFGDLKTVVTGQAVELGGKNEDGDTSWEFSGDENAEKVRTIGFDICYEEHEQRESIISAVHEAIDRLPKGEKTKQQLRLVFDTFVQKRQEGGSAEKVKQSDVRRELGIARSTMSDYVNIIKGLEEPIIENFYGEVGKH